MKYIAELSVSFDDEEDGKMLSEFKRIYQHIATRLQQASASSSQNTRIAVIGGEQSVIRMTSPDIQSYTTIQISGPAYSPFILVVSLNDLYIHGYIINHGDEAYYYHFDGLAIATIPGTQTIETNLVVTYPSSVKEGTHKIGSGPLRAAVNRMGATNELPIRPTPAQYSSYNVPSSVITFALMICEGMRIQLMRRLVLRLMSDLTDSQIGPANGAYITNWAKLGDQLQKHFMVYPDHSYAIDATEEHAYDIGTYEYREAISRVSDILKIILLLKFYVINTDRKPDKEFKRSASDIVPLVGRATFEKNKNTFVLFNEFGVEVSSDLSLDLVCNIDNGLLNFTSTEASLIPNEWCADVGVIFYYENREVLSVTIFPGRASGAEKTDAPDIIKKKYVYYGEKRLNGALVPKITLRDKKAYDISEVTEEMLSMETVVLTNDSSAYDVLNYLSRNGVLAYNNPKYTLSKFSSLTEFLYNSEPISKNTKFS